jgi:hypothetical protein
MVSGTTLASKFNDGEARVIRRTTPPDPCYEIGATYLVGRAWEVAE